MSTYGKDLFCDDLVVKKINGQTQVDHNLRTLSVTNAATDSASATIADKDDRFFVATLGTPSPANSKQTFAVALPSGETMAGKYARVWMTFQSPTYGFQNYICGYAPSGASIVFERQTIFAGVSIPVTGGSDTPPAPVVTLPTIGESVNVYIQILDL